MCVQMINCFRKEKRPEDFNTRDELPLKEYNDLNHNAKTKGRGEGEVGSSLVATHVFMDQPTSPDMLNFLTSELLMLISFLLGML